MRFGGAIGGENVGMSNRNSDESSEHRKPKISLAMLISQGLGGPNPFAERQTRDGQPVNIPALLFLFKERRNLKDKVHYWICSRALHSCKANLSNKLPRKTWRVKETGSVFQTDTGRQA